MTFGLRRYYGRHHLHFITTSCYHRLPKLDSSEKRDLFLDILEQARQRFRFVVIGYVVMPEHVHLLISETGLVNPSVVMKWVKFRVSRTVIPSAHTSDSIRRSRSESSRSDVWGTQHFWQHRFYDFNVFTEHKRAEKLHYMHMNPVERGLVKRPEDWRWSSYRFYAFREIGPVNIDEGWPEVKMLSAH